MNRKLKRAFAIFGKLRSQEQKPQDSTISTDVMYPTRRRLREYGELPTPTKLIDQGVTPRDLQKDFEFALKEYRNLWEQNQKEKAEARTRAEKQWAEQKTPWYRFGLGGIYGVYGTFKGSTGYNQTGLKIGEEIKKLDVTKLREILRRLDNGKVPPPLKGYDKTYIKECRDWLLSIIRQKS